MCVPTYVPCIQELMSHNSAAQSLLLLIFVCTAHSLTNIAVIFHLCVGYQVEKVDARGVQLAALFMAGVDTALFINDVCGQPLPWEHCCPWGFFDGKLFQSKLARAARDRAALLDMCEGQVRTRVCLRASNPFGASQHGDGEK